MADGTKLAIVEALKRLLLTTTIEKITIGDIAEVCGINRMTFYYHFRDIYDCLAWAAEHEAEEALENCKTFSHWDKGFLNILKKAKARKPYCMSIFRGVSREQLERYLYSYVSGLIQPVIVKEAQGRNISEKDLTFIVNFYKYPFVGIFLSWVAGGMEEEPEYIVEQLSTMLADSIYEALDRFEKVPSAGKKLIDVTDR